jgi:hypothetical protein
MTTPNQLELFRFRLARGFYAWNVGEVMRTVTENPKVLSNCGKTLALQRACDMDRTIVSVELIRLLIEEGARQNFGERGGLMTARNYGSAPLQVLVKRGSLRVLKFLSEAQPPLLRKEDVSTFNLLHFAAGYGHVDVARFLMKLDPDASNSIDQDGALPIHMTCSSRSDFSKLHMIRELLLDDFITRNYIDTDTDMDMDTDMNTDSDMDIDIDNCRNTTTSSGGDSHDQDALDIFDWFFPNVDCTKDAIATYVQDVAAIINRFDVSIPILCAAIRVGAPHSHLKCIIDLVHDSANVRDKSNRLPIHLAAERGIKWSEGLKDIINSNPLVVYEADIKTNLDPSVLAASASSSTSNSNSNKRTPCDLNNSSSSSSDSHKSCDLDSIYELMRINPQTIVNY